MLSLCLCNKILALIPIKRLHLPDITAVDSSSINTGSTDSRGRTTSNYTAGYLELTTRAGHSWRSASMTQAFGDAAGKMEQRIERFITASGEPRLQVWSMGLLSNLVGVPFAIVSLLFIWMWLAKLGQLLGFRGGNTLL